MEGNFVVERINNSNKGTLFSSFRPNIYDLIRVRNLRRDNIVNDILLKSVSKESECCKNIDDLYMHTYVIRGGYESAILALSNYLLDEENIKESNMYSYEGTDGILFPFLFVCTHAAELSMKAFIYAHGKPYETYHNIEGLLKMCIDISQNDIMKNKLDEYSDFIKELNDVSKNGFAMRYSLDRNKNNYLKYVYVIDVEKLRDKMCSFTTLLSRFAYGHIQYF